MLRQKRKNNRVWAAALSIGLGLSVLGTCQASSLFCNAGAQKVSIEAYESERVSENKVSDNTDRVSWFSWFSGDSASYQFHFLDLLELLYHNDSEEYHPAQ